MPLGYLATYYIIISVNIIYSFILTLKVVRVIMMDLSQDFEYPLHELLVA